MVPFLLKSRTRRRRTAVRFLEVLAVTAEARGWRCVKLYEPEQFPLPVPLLWVYASGVAEDVGGLVSVRAVPGGRWAFYRAQRGRFGYLHPCGDPKEAAEQVDLLLKHLIFPSTVACHRGRGCLVSGLEDGFHWRTR